MDSIIYGGRERNYAHLDAAAFIQNALFGLYANGYGACWIGFACWDTLGNIHVDPALYDEFYTHFNLKKNLVPVCMIAVGKPAVIPHVPPRQQVANLIIKDFVE